MKFYFILVCVAITVVGFSQNPVEKIDFGKCIMPKPGESPLVKLPKSSNWKKYPDLNEELLPQKKKIHYSRTFQGDTASVSQNGEYVEFRENPYPSVKTPHIYYSELVTNADWLIFQEYVRDSIARMILSDQFDLELFRSEFEEEYPGMDESDWPLDWGAKINWKKEKGNAHFPLVEELNYPMYERCNRKSEIDCRKLHYAYNWCEFNKCESLKEVNINNIIDLYKVIRNTDCSEYIHKEWVSLFRDSTLWVKDTSLNHFNNIEDGMVRFYNSNKFFNDEPVTGINAPQAKAYLHWLEKHHQQRLDAGGIDVKVVYELPPSSINKESNTADFITIPSFDLTNWQVTNSDYEVFVKYISDSISRKILFEELGNEGEFGLKQYGSEFDLLSEEDWTLNWKTKIKKQYSRYLIDMYYPAFEGDTSILDKRKLLVKQFYYDFKTAAIEVERIPGDNGSYYRDPLIKDKVSLIRNAPDNCFRGSYNGALGKNLNIGYLNDLGQVTDVYAHADRGSFIIRDVLSIYPGVIYRQVNVDCRIKGNCYEDQYYSDSLRYCQVIDCKLCPQKYDWEIVPNEYDFKSSPKALITSIEYFQYVAYWRWRIRNRDFSIKNENPVISNYIPSKEEFFKIQKGESITHAKELHGLPTPSFRYLVSFYVK